MGRLPARGKTHIARSLRRYLRWLGINTQVFHLGNYRRDLKEKVSQDYFNPSKLREITAAASDMEDLRKQVCTLALADLVDFLKNQKGQVGIFDGSNTTAEKRMIIHSFLESHGIQVIYIGTSQY